MRRENAAGSKSSRGGRAAGAQTVAVEPREAGPAGSCSVEIQVDGKVIRRYGAPFERAAMALAKEVLRRLSPGTGFRVVVQRDAGTLQSWNATSDGWKSTGPIAPVVSLA